MTEIDPYRAPAAEVEQPVAGLAFQASRGERLAAFVVDALLGALAVVPYVLGVVWARAAAHSGSLVPFWIGLGVSLLMALALLALQIALLHGGSWTFGKRALRIRIVRTDGSRAGFARTFWLRSVVPAAVAALSAAGACCLPFVCIAVGGLGPLLVLAVDAAFILGPEQRCLHDRLADTTVVKAGVRADEAANGSA